jgi:hypothetical protein
MSTDKQYLSCAETAALIRKQLAKHFPETKFYIRSKVYSGGASIDIDYIDGPTESAVKRITSSFEGAEFDGMVDLKSYNTGYLLPDGSAALAVYAKDSQTDIHFTSPHPDAQRVHFGADFIFVNRHYSEEFARPKLEKFAQEQNIEIKYRTNGYMWISHNNKKPCFDWEMPRALDHWQHEALKDALFNVSAPRQLTAKPQAPKPSNDTPRAEQEAIEISWDRDWTWIKFPANPGPQVCEILKNELHARYSGRRQAWYIAERIDETTVRMRIQH